MKYLSDVDIYEDDAGKQFMKNEFKKDACAYIHVSDCLWSVSYAGKEISINWRKALPEELWEPAKKYLHSKMRTNAPTYLGQFEAALVALKRMLPRGVSDYSEIRIDDWLDIWDGLSPHNKSLIRSFYSWMAIQSDSDEMRQIAAELNLWKARNNTRTLRRVLDWDTKYGAFTSDETEVLLRLFQETQTDDTQENAIRLFGWVLFETLKRPSQILGMRATALETVSNEEIDEYFLVIPKAKAQSAEDSGYWRITSELAEEIMKFSNRPEVERLQRIHDRLIVFPNDGLDEHGEISSLTAGAALLSWVNSQGLLSPRTGEQMYVRPYRIRHTGGTRLAMQGFSVDEIMDVLEHDSLSSCQAYIDAVGADLIPAIEKADRKLGSLFVNLNNIFFNGKITEEVDKEKAIYVPDFSHGPALVGSCNRNVSTKGRCPHHPFHKCYGGCPQFLAWRDGDHNKALSYTEKELARWNEANGHKERNKNIKDFERLYAAIEEVKRQIDEGVRE